MLPSLFLRLIEAVEDTYNWGFYLMVLLVWSPVLLRNEDKFLVCLYRLNLILLSALSRFIGGIAWSI